MADLVTKSAAFAAHYQPHDPGVSFWWIPNILGVQTSFNGGALWGIFQGGSWWLAGLSIVALSGILIWLFVYKMAASRYLTVALGMITGGIIGNLYDRLGFGYSVGFPPEHTCHVRDWIHFRLQGVPLFDPWPNFNIADSLLVVGAAMLVCFAMFSPDPGGTDESGEMAVSDSTT